LGGKLYIASSIKCKLKPGAVRGKVRKVAIKPGGRRQGRGK